MTIITDYTLDPDAKTITLGAAYSTLKIEEVLSIFNLTRSIQIYDYREPRKYNAPKNVNGNDISISNGVITYVKDAGMDAADKLYIEVDGASAPLNVNVNGTTNTSSDLFTNETVAASTTVTSTNPIPTGQLSKLLCYVSNSGASANCTVNIYASPTNSTSGRKKMLTPPFTLGDGSITTYEAGNGIDPKQLDNYIWGEIINNDSVNPAIITVTLSMFR